MGEVAWQYTPREVFHLLDIMMHKTAETCSVRSAGRLVVLGGARQAGGRVSLPLHCGSAGGSAPLAMPVDAVFCGDLFTTAGGLTCAPTTAVQCGRCSSSRGHLLKPPSGVRGMPVLVGSRAHDLKARPRVWQDPNHDSRRRSCLYYYRKARSRGGGVPELTWVTTMDAPFRPQRTAPALRASCSIAKVLWTKEAGRPTRVAAPGPSHNPSMIQKVVGVHQGRQGNLHF